VNWILNAAPVKLHLVGGRQARTDEKMFGNVYDHFSGHYEYPNGVIVSYQGAQIDKMTTKNYERIRGTKGVAYTDWALSRITGEKPFEAKSEMGNAVIRQFQDQVNAIRTNSKLNEGRQIAESSLTAIAGRMSAYTGRELKFDWAMNASKLDLSPPNMELGPYEMQPVAIPGQTQLI
jgi:myo-inositol 2-dehydrogenase / D-chiro-inositol 1-dehydrogenase